MLTPLKHELQKVLATADWGIKPVCFVNNVHISYIKHVSYGQKVLLVHLGKYRLFVSLTLPLSLFSHMHASLNEQSEYYCE